MGFVKKVGVTCLLVLAPIVGLGVGAEVGHVVAHHTNQVDQSGVAGRAFRDVKDLGVGSAAGGALGILGDGMWIGAALSRKRHGIVSHRRSQATVG